MTNNPFEDKIKMSCKVTTNHIVGAPKVYVSNKSNTVRLNVAAVQRLDIKSRLNAGSKDRLRVNFYVNKSENTLIVEFARDGVYAYSKNSGAALHGIRNTLAAYGMAPLVPGAYEIISMFADLEKHKYYVEISLYGGRSAVNQNAK